MTEETLRDLYVEYLGISYRSFLALFDVPLNQNIYDFSKDWLEVSVSKANSNNIPFLLDDDAITITVLRTIRPTRGNVFDSAGVTEDGMFDKIFADGVENSYAGLLAGFHTAISALYRIITKLDAEDLVALEAPNVAELGAMLFDKSRFIFDFLLEFEKGNQKLYVNIMDDIAKFATLLDTYAGIAFPDEEIEEDLDDEEDEE